MGALRFRWVVPLAFVTTLVLSACGGDGKGSAANPNDDDATAAAGVTTADEGSPGAAATSDTKSGDATDLMPPTGTPANGATSPSNTRPPEPTALPTQDPQRVKEFTNGILGDAQQPLFYLQLITGDIPCEAGCNDTLPRRWSMAITVCGAGRWEARKSEDGFNEATHGPLIAALIESCNLIGAKYSAGGTPDDSDEWREVANNALNILGPQYDILLESTIG